MIERAERGLAVLALVLLTMAPLGDVLFRKLGDSGLPGAIPITQHLNLWAAFLGALLAARNGKLLALSTPELLSEKMRARMAVFTAFIGAGCSYWLFRASLELATVERTTGTEVAWGIPVWVAMLIMPAGFLLIALRLVIGAGRSARVRLLAALGLLVPELLAHAPPEREAAIIVICVVLAAATLAGMPLFAALGGAAIALFWSANSPIASVAFDAYRLSAHPLLPSIPLFCLGGYIMAESGASQRLTRAFTSLIGWMPGGLAVVATLVLAFFTPLTGASGVTILSMGGLFLPMLRQASYPERTSIGLITVSGSIGLLLPPSLPVILYAISARTPIDSLFYAALLPGAVLITAIAAWGAYKGHVSGAVRTPFAWREAGAALWGAKWELLMPVVVLASYFGGFATLVESAAISVAYALVVSCAIVRDLRPGDVVRIAATSVELTGGFLLIVTVALGFTNFLVTAEVPTRALEWMQAHVESPALFLLALNVFLIAVGALMDIYSAILVIVPLIAPMGLAYGIDPIHLGIVFLANMELGYLMPPMGENLFLSAYRFNRPLADVYRSTLPFIVILTMAVLLLTYVPAITTALR